MNTISKIIYISLLMLFLTACSTPQTAAPKTTKTTDSTDFSFQNQYVRGTDLGFTDEAKAEMREAGVNLVDLTLAIQHELQRQKLLVSGAPYVLWVTIDEFKLNPAFKTALYSFRAEDDFINGKAKIVDNNREALHTYKVSASVSRTEAITGDHQQRLAQFYKTFAEQVVNAILEQQN